VKALSGIFHVKSGPDETQNPLEQRLFGLLSKMSIQKKIEQLCYETDRNNRPGIELNDQAIKEHLKSDESYFSPDDEWNNNWSHYHNYSLIPKSK
jgi:hypothetical protein